MITRFIEQIFCLPFAAKGMLWSLGLHATAFAATYTLFSSPVAHVTFAGNRFAVQIEASFSEVPFEEECETFLEFEPMPPVEEPPHQPLAQLEPQLTVEPPLMQLPEATLQAGDASDSSEPQTSQPTVLEDTPPEEEPKKPAEPKPKPTQPPTPQANAAAKQIAGFEEKEPPDLSSNRAPSYPSAAIRKHLEGTVLLRLTITSTGKVELVEVVKSSGHAILDRAAVEAVSTWHALPAEVDGQPVSSIELLPVQFRF